MPISGRGEAYSKTGKKLKPAYIKNKMSPPDVPVYRKKPHRFPLFMAKAAVINNMLLTNNPIRYGMVIWAKLFDKTIEFMALFAPTLRIINEAIISVLNRPYMAKAIFAQPKITVNKKNGLKKRIMQQM